MNDLELYFAVREPAYNLIQYVNHSPVYTKTQEELARVAKILSEVDTFKEWILKESPPKKCRVNLDDPIVFDAFSKYVVSFFTTSLEVKKQVSCDLCQIYHYLLGPAKLTPESRKRTTKLLENTLGKICAQERIELDTPDISPESTYYIDLVYITYVLESAKRVKHKGAGRAIHVLWQKMNKTEQKSLSLQEFEKREKRLIKTLKSFQNS